jgi:uncharacterized glyoxalase superfamily protein PhnB
VRRARIAPLRARTLATTVPPALAAISPQFLVSDVARAAEYYRDKLGFEVGPYFGEPPEFVIVRRDAARIMLSQVEGARGGSNRKWKRVAIDAYVWVEDIERLYAEFRHKGAFLSGPPQLKVYGIREIEVFDLDGYVICFGQ